MLLKYAADINAQDVNGNTALHFAVLAGSEELIALLLKSGANKNIRNRWGMTPRMAAQGHGHNELANLIGL